MPMIHGPMTSRFFLHDDLVVFMLDHTPVKRYLKPIYSYKIPAWDGCVWQRTVPLLTTGQVLDPIRGDMSGRSRCMAACPCVTHAGPLRRGPARYPRACWVGEVVYGYAWGGSGPTAPEARAPEYASPHAPFSRARLSHRQSPRERAPFSPAQNSCSTICIYSPCK